MRFAYWAGPALLTLGLAGILAIFVQPPDERTTVGWWILSNAFAYERVLPLTGFGVALGLVDLPFCIAALVLFALSIALGFFFAEPLLSTLAPIPGAIMHRFFSGPISCIAVGLSLAIPGRFRQWSVPVAAIIAGVMFAVAIWLTDVGSHDSYLAHIGFGFGFWLVVAVCVTVRAFRQSWFETAGRIFGSWLIAIGLLYGGATLIPRRELPTAPQQLQSPPTPNQITGPGDIAPPADQSNQRHLPDWFNPSQQP